MIAKPKHPAGLVLLSALALLLACSNSHGPNAGTSGSNWLRCAKLSDCRAAAQAVECGDEGFCLDARGERIAADDARKTPTKQDAGVRDSGPGAPTAGTCLWGTNELLALAGVSATGRRNCGRYPYFDANGVRGGFECLNDVAVDMGAAELSVNTCVDCYLLMTYVATWSGELILIRRERDAFGGDGIAEVSVHGCDGLGIDEDGDDPSVVCLNPYDRGHCSEPLSQVPDEEPALPVQPLKLGDVSATGNVARVTLNLYVNNRAFRTESVDIDVYVDDQHVVAGDFDVGGPRDWFETAIQVPVGSHVIRVGSVDGDTDLQRSIDVPAERWAVIDFWSEPLKEPYFTFSLHDEPVSFE